MKHFKLSFIFLFILVSIQAKPVLPTPVLSGQFRDLIATYNTGDTAQYDKFYRLLSSNKEVVSKNVKQTFSEFSFSGRIKLMKIIRTSPTETTIVARNVSFGCWFEIYWITDPAGNYKEHHMRPVRLSEDFLQTGKLSKQQVLDSAHAYTNNLTSQKVFAGNVLVALHGKQLYNKSFGNNPDGKPNNAGQQFDLASMGKLFTTISILQLADLNRLCLEDSVGKLMPQLSNPALNTITVRELLTHTSGMGDFFEDPAYDPMSGKKFTYQDFWPAIEKDKLHFAPGKGFRYSNTGFLLLGLIVEKLSGQDFTSYLQQHIFTPAKMVSTSAGTGAGGGQSTIMDIYNFSEAIGTNKLLKSATTQQFLHYHQKDWGLGQEYQQLGSEIITGHSGGFPGVCTELNMYQNSGYTVIILSNTEPPFGHFVSDKFKELIVRKKS